MLTATIKEYKFVNFPEGERLVGRIYNDVGRNYPDGYRIITSVVVSKDLENSQVKTRNSLYQLSGGKVDDKNGSNSH